MLLALYIMTGVDTETWHEQASFFQAERLKTRADKRQKRKAKEALDIKVQFNKILLVLTLHVRRVVEPANQELASTAIPEVRTHPQQH